VWRRRTSPKRRAGSKEVWCCAYRGWYGVLAANGRSNCGLTAGCVSTDPCKTTGKGSYSKDLRLKVLSAADRGVPRKEIVEVFGV
jgi:hypothetical protein